MQKWNTIVEGSNRSHGTRYLATKLTMIQEGVCKQSISRLTRIRPQRLGLSVVTRQTSSDHHPILPLRLIPLGSSRSRILIDKPGSGTPPEPMIASTTPETPSNTRVINPLGNTPVEAFLSKATNALHPTPGGPRGASSNSNWPCCLCSRDRR